MYPSPSAAAAAQLKHLAKGTHLIQARLVIDERLGEGTFRRLSEEAGGSFQELVAFANALPKLVPARHRLAYVHLPLAEGKDPPPLDAGYYAPFRDIVAPEGVRIIAGFVHEGRSLDEHRRILGAIEDARGRAVDVASSCGLGRRSEEVASHLLGVTAKLVDG